MKKFYTLLVLLSSIQVVFSQEFSLPVYFEDALGNKDTLVFGYDVNATNGIDPQFGEINYIQIPFGDDFEARIADYNIPDIDIYFPDPTGFHTDIQIKEKDCIGDDFPMISLICLNKVTYPLKVFWDQSLFGDTCLQKSLVTDWYPGLWFDATFGNEQGPFYLNENDTATFTHTTHHFLTLENDTLDVLFFTLASVNNFIVGTEDRMESGVIKLYPNPVVDNLNVQSSGKDHKISSVQLYDLSGKKYRVAFTGNSVDFSHLPNGMYYICMIFQEGDSIVRKIIVDKQYR